MTIIEMSLAISLLLLFSSLTIFSLGGYRNWKLGKEASNRLRSVYLAQKFLLADRPTLRLADVSSGDLIPYLPGNASSLPAVEDLNGSMLSVDFRVIPPVVTGGYDPSGSAQDGLWDVGKH